MNLWDVAGDLVANYHKYDRSDEQRLPESSSLFDPLSMITAEFLGEIIGGEEPIEGIKALPHEEQMRSGKLPEEESPHPPVGTMTVSFGRSRVEIAVPEAALSVASSMSGELAVRLAQTAEELWGTMLKTGQNLSEQGWKELEPQTIENKMREYGMSEAEASRPNFRTGEYAQSLVTHAFGDPKVEQTAEGTKVSWGPQPGAFPSARDMKYREAIGGAGPNTENPASGRGHNTLRPPRTFEFTPSMRDPFQKVIEDWTEQVNAAHAKVTGERVQETEWDLA